MATDKWLNQYLFNHAAIAAVGKASRLAVVEIVEVPIVDTKEF